jgi:dCTP diphosphatase
MNIPAPNVPTLASLVTDLRAFTAERDWQQFHDPKNLAMLVASEAGELLAEYWWIANTASDAHSAAAEPRARIAAEIGDVGIALLMLCDRIGVDLCTAMSDKLILNGRRYPADTSRGQAERPDHA